MQSNIPTKELISLKKKGNQKCSGTSEKDLNWRQIFLHSWNRDESIYIENFTPQNQRAEE